MGGAGEGAGSERVPEQESLTETLFRFAVPVSGLAPGCDRENLESVLCLARIAWNGEVLRQVTGSEDRLAESRRRLGNLPAPVGPGYLGLLEQLVARKRAQFADDLRAIGKIDLRGEDGAQTLVVQEISPEDLLLRPRAHLAIRHARIDMQTYLPEDGLMKSIIVDERMGARVHGAIAAEGSLAASGPWIPSETECDRRTDGRLCKGRAVLSRSTRGERLDWECQACGWSREVHGWRGTPWDISGREAFLAALHAGERVQLSLSDAERRALQISVGLHVRAIGALAAARRGEADWRVDASREEVEDLAVAAAAELAKRRPSRKRKQYARAAERLHRALGRSEAVRRAAETADLLSFRALAHRATIRRVPRVEPCGAHRLAVVLWEVEPVVRREIVVRSDTTLEELHAILQVAFGWSDFHPHAFRAGKALYVRPDQSEDVQASRSHRATLLDVAPQAGDSLVYDFGDGRGHAIQVLEVLPAAAPGETPRCLSGEGAAPPEDAGGPGGHPDFPAASDDPADLRRDVVRSRLARPFDPRAFDLDATNRLLRQLGRWQA